MEVLSTDVILFVIIIIITFMMCTVDFVYYYTFGKCFSRSIIEIKKKLVSKRFFFLSSHKLSDVYLSI